MKDGIEKMTKEKTARSENLIRNFWKKQKEEPGDFISILFHNLNTQLQIFLLRTAKTSSNSKYVEKQLFSNVFKLYNLYIFTSFPNKRMSPLIVTCLRKVYPRWSSVITKPSGKKMLKKVWKILFFLTLYPSLSRYFKKRDKNQNIKITGRQP